MARIDFVTGNARQYLPDVEALAAIPDRAEALLAGHTTADVARTPAGGDWSGARIIGHMTAYARHLHDDLHRMTWMTDPALEAWDEAAEAGGEDWERHGAAELVDMLTDATRLVVELLKDLPDASWGRAGMHPRGGRRSIRQHARSQLEHLQHHLEQLAEALDG